MQAQSLYSITLGHREGPQVRAVEIRHGRVMLDCEQSKAKVIQKASVDGAGIWLGHVQNNVADTTFPIGITVSY
jgi:hypothetical protein